MDGTLVTQDKVLTPAAIDAVHALHDAGVLFAITSGRPPRGMEMLIDPLDLRTPISAFNGGIVVDRDMHTLEQKAIPKDLVGPVIDLMKSYKLDVWLYRGADWYVTDPKGPHVDREAWTVKFDPTVVGDYTSLTDDVAKLVGVSDDHDAIQKASEAAHDKFGDHVTAAALPALLPRRHAPRRQQGIRRPLPRQALRPRGVEIATMGDMPNDILMFAHSGLSIAMGNADPQVKKAARRVTASNEDDGFAKAVERFVLPTVAR